jgi:hypothetical protein
VLQLSAFRYGRCSYVSERGAPKHLAFSGKDFSLWGYVLGRSKPHRLKPMPLKTVSRALRNAGYCAAKTRSALPGTPPVNT